MKILRVRDPPCRSDLSPRQRCQKILMCATTPEILCCANAERLVNVGCTVGNPKREGMMSTAASFPLIKKKGLSTSRRKASLPKVQKCGDLHTNNQLLCPNYSMRLSISPVLLNIEG